MQLAGIDCQVPSCKVSNEDIVELVKFYSAPEFKDLRLLEVVISRYLKKTGIESRYWRGPKEKALDLILTSIDRALKMAGITKNQINFLIYSSIDRGFHEPANSSFIAKALELERIRSFDIVDACMGWGSAVQVANSFFKSDPSINYILILNAEFPLDTNGTVLPRNFTYQAIHELRYKGASLTLGEGVTASIFKRNDATDIAFEFLEQPHYADLCTIPLSNFEKLLTSLEGSNYMSELQFRTYGDEMLSSGMESAIIVIQNLLKKVQYNPKVILPHSVSVKVINDAMLKLKIDTIVCSTFSEFGNLASASIPSALTKAMYERVLIPGDRSIAWIASAGMKFAAFEIFH